MNPETRNHPLKAGIIVGVRSNLGIWTEKVRPSKSEIKSYDPHIIPLSLRLFKYKSTVEVYWNEHLRYMHVGTILKESNSESFSIDIQAIFEVLHLSVEFQTEPLVT